MFSFNNDIAEIEKEIREYEQNMKEQKEQNDEDNDYEYEEYNSKNKKSSKFGSNTSNKEAKEDENYIYVADNGDLHYIDQDGNTYKCREEDGDYIIEERISSIHDPPYGENNVSSKNSKTNSKKEKTKSKDTDFLKEKEEFDDEDEDNDIFDENVKEAIFEEFSFTRENAIKDPYFSYIHKLRDKVDYF